MGLSEILLLHVRTQVSTMTASNGVLHAAMRTISKRMWTVCGTFYLIANRPPHEWAKNTRRNAAKALAPAALHVIPSAAAPALACKVLDCFGVAIKSVLKGWELACKIVGSCFVHARIADGK